jgi:hypothetical protein
MPIQISFTATTAQELRDLMADFALFAQDTGLPLATVAQNAGTPEQASVTTGEKRPRGRPRKSDATEATEAAPTIAQEMQDEDIHHAAASAPASAASAPDPVSDLTPADARARAIKLAQGFFAAHPNALPEIQKIQSKFGIKMFADVVDDRAHELLADVMMLTNKTPGV